MDNGKELIEMVCMCYESPDDADEDDMHDFSKCLPESDWKCLSKAVAPACIHVQHTLQVAAALPHNWWLKWFNDTSYALCVGILHTSFCTQVISGFCCCASMPPLSA